MIEKVNPKHPDKICDRIAGAIVDMAYMTEENPKVAVEVLLGHGKCHVIIETTANLSKNKIKSAIKRIAGNVKCDIVVAAQDTHLANNQKGCIRCGDNGILKEYHLLMNRKHYPRLQEIFIKNIPMMESTF